MKKNYIFIVFCFFLLLKAQAQTPSINEAQRISYFSDSFTKSIDDDIDRLGKRNKELDVKITKEKEQLRSDALQSEITANNTEIEALRKRKALYGAVNASNDYEGMYNKLIRN